MMRLISMHINNYGRLSDFDFKFDNVSTFCEDNGYGKTTIASFIKAMFYGLETYKKNAAKFLDRMHFYPFRGGKFGGNVIFEYDGHEYRIERDFDVKSETKDTLTVYCDGEKTEELGTVPGITIFGINKDSFERLISIDADEIEIEADSDINKKLNNYVENVGEEFDIDGVLKKVKDYKKEKTKQLAETKKAIKDAENDVRNMDTTSENLSKKYIELNAAEKEKNTTAQEYDKARELQFINEKWKHYEEKTENAKQKERDLSVIRGKYPKGIPTDGQLKSMDEIFEGIRECDIKLQNGRISEEQKTVYEDLEEKYREHLPDDYEIRTIDEKISEYKKTKEKILILSKKRRSEDEEKLVKRFEEKELDSDIAFLEKNINHELLQMENELNNIQPKITETEVRGEEKKKGKGLFVILLIVSLCFVGAGIGLMIQYFVPGIIVLTLGILLLIADMFLFLYDSIKNVKTDTTVTVEKDNPEYILKKEKTEELKNDIIRQFAKYNYVGDHMSLLLYRFKQDADAYQKLLISEDDDRATLEKYKECFRKTEKELDDFFADFNMENVEYGQAQETIKKEVAMLTTLRESVHQTMVKRREVQMEKAELQKGYDDFYLQFGLSKEMQLARIKQDVTDMKRLSGEYEELLKDAENYKAENALNERPQTLECNLDELADLKERMLDEYKSIRQEIDNMEEAVAGLDDRKSELSNLKENKTSLEEKIKVADALSKELQQADQKLKDKYVAPIKNRFCEYADLLEETIGEKVSMDKNYRISFEREGALRSFKHLSRGNLAICAFCFRLALLDNMFEKEVPFIIMDDPFVALDGNHFEKMKLLIEKLSGDKQIIYFCCHESRCL